MEVVPLMLLPLLMGAMPPSYQFTRCDCSSELWVGFGLGVVLSIIVAVVCQRVFKR